MLESFKSEDVREDVIKDSAADDKYVSNKNVAVNNTSIEAYKATSNKEASANDTSNEIYKTKATAVKASVIMYYQCDYEANCEAGLRIHIGKEAVKQNKKYKISVGG